MLITHGRIATFGKDPQVIDDGAICIADDQIIAVGPTAELRARYPEAEQLDAKGQLILPGSICAHTHFYGAFARGMAIPGAPARNFIEILQKLWWRLDRALDEESIRLSALVCLIDAIRNGTTTLIDHHASPQLIDGSLDICAAAIVQAGLRVCECYEVTDRNGADGAQAGIAENVRFAKQLAARPHPLLAASFGLHASLTIGPQTLERCVGEARALGLGFHIHLAEDNADQLDSETHYGQRVGAHLHEKGVLGEKTLAAHCVHVNQSEINLLAKTNTKVSHQPRSNMNNAVGTTPVQQLLDAGVCVGLGNDGFSNNMYTEMKTAYLVHKSTAHDPRVMSGDTVARLAYTNNARIASLFWPHPVGEISPGAYADLVFLDYCPYTPLTAGNLPWQIIFGIDGTHVKTTIVAGRVLMRDRVLLTLDEERIAAQAREIAPQVWQRFEEISRREQ
ncbi:5-methylthioadenosine/S-adenosylhomocysteine deaminase [Thermoflexales bacterium]|nr:5-methylthioadenosine/S-adenosylhomocysteine deaminase [Thermoflexales bacterium]